jgi:pyrophosphate--fructose-6-phosphate 1-phosphotransferase
MGRHCGWLTAESAIKYRKKLLDHLFSDDLLLKKSHWDIDAVFIPEITININEEGKRLLNTMDKKGCVNIFLSEGACINEIILDMEKQNKKIKRDAFGHVRLDNINPGQWFAKQFSKLIDAEKILVQKSGYFARSSAPNEYDIRLIKDSAIFAVHCAMESKSGVVGLDEENEDKMSLINFNRIKGGKAFNPRNEKFIHLLNEIGQPQ